MAVVSRSFSLSLLVLILGCHRPSAVPNVDSAALRTAKYTSSVLPIEQLKKLHADETGVVPILEYHDISLKESRWGRSITAFRADLDRLYKENYRPITFAEYLDNKITTEAGKSPVILTFDDARESQFRILPDGSIDPNCAVGIMEAFHKSHSDFPAKAVFYVLPLSGFGQPPLIAKKMQMLLDMGYELGNHTITHTALRKLSDEEVQKEIAGCADMVLKMAPKARMDTIALPLGSAPKNRELLSNGEYNGVKYHNRAALLVGSNPALSPIALKFDPMRLPRIQAIEGPMGITDWLNSLKRHPERRYVSDGIPGTISFPKTQSAKVDTSRMTGLTVTSY